MRSHETIERNEINVEELPESVVEILNSKPELLEKVNKLYQKHEPSISHMENLANLCQRLLDSNQDIAKSLDQDVKKNLVLAAFFHDIGKADVEAELLNNTDKLTPDEWKKMQKHTENTRKILRDAGLESLLPIVMRHHELQDDSYPRKDDKDIKLERRKPLSDSENIAGEIVSIFDKFNAMTSDDRTYQKTLTVEEARDKVLIITRDRTSLGLDVLRDVVDFLVEESQQLEQN